MGVRAGSSIGGSHLHRRCRRRDDVSAGGTLFRGSQASVGRGTLCDRWPRSVPRMWPCSTSWTWNSRLPISQLEIGDRFVVRPGETVATDGEVIFGDSSIDRSAMTGESLPVDVSPGDRVVGGTVSVGGRLVVRATRVGARHAAGPHAAPGRGCPERKGRCPTAGRPHLGGLRPRGARHSHCDSRGLAGGRWLLRAGVQCGDLGSDHRLPLRSRPGHPDGPACRFRRRCPPGDLLQGIPGTGGLAGDRHRRARQDGDGHRRQDDVVTDIEGVARCRACHAPALGRGARTGRPSTWWRGPSPPPPKKVGQPASRSTGSRRQPGIGARGMVEGHEVSIGKAALFADRSVTVPATMVARCAEWEAVGRTAVLVGRDDPLWARWPSPTRSDPPLPPLSGSSRRWGSTVCF